jgi:general secretion pathway protein I
MSDQGQSGFSLVEVIAALGVFSIAAMGMIHLSNQTQIGAAHVSMRTLAEIEASNLIADAVTAPPPISPGLETGKSVQRGRTLHWSRTVTATPQAGLLLVAVEVRNPTTNQVLAQVQSVRTER